MRYPFWLPYPKAWLRAIALFFLLLPIYALQFALIRIFGIPFVLSSTVFDLEAFLTFVSFLGLFVFLFLPIFLLSHFHQFFWNKPDPKLPKFIPTPKSFIAGVADWFFNVSSLLMASIIWLDVAEKYVERGLPDFLIWLLTATWFVIVSYYYHFWFFLGRRYWRIRAKLAQKNK
jgi:hypothetical protein